MGPQDDIFDLLVKHKADACIKNYKGQTIIDIVVSFYYFMYENYVVKSLIKHIEKLCQAQQCPVA